MATHKKQKGGDKYHARPYERITEFESDKFAMIFRSMVESPAHKALTPQAKCVLVVMRLQAAKAKEDWTFTCHYKTIAELSGVRRNYISDYLNELECFEFIKIEERGTGRKATLYSFSDGWKSINDPDEIEALKAECKRNWRSKNLENSNLEKIRDL